MGKSLVSCFLTQCSTRRYCSFIQYALSIKEKKFNKLLEHVWARPTYTILVCYFYIWSDYRFKYHIL